MDFKAFGGSLGCAEGELLAEVFEYANKKRIGVMIIARSGGVRMQEGTTALMMMAKASVAVNAHKEAGLGYVSIFEDPCYGGVSASYCMQGDVRIGVKGTRIGFAGPNVILNTMYNQNQKEFDKAAPQGFQSAEFTFDHGQLDAVVDTLDDAIKLGVHVLHLLSQGESEIKEEASMKEDIASVVKAFEKEEEEFKGKKLPQHDHNRTRDLSRVQAQDIFKDVFLDYIELSGDGKMGADKCIHGGLARLPLYKELEEGGEKEGEKRELKMCRTVVVIGTFRAHTEAGFAEMGYGMATPHGYRTALKLFELGERFHLPIISLIDTVGAEPSFNAEQDGQSESISTNLLKMSGLRVPLISCVIGEGGSGGALGVGMGNSVAMCSSGWYSVISPEGAASILGRYKDEKEKKEELPKDAAKLAGMQQIFADQLLEKKVIDSIIWEEEDLGHERENYENYPYLKKRLLRWIWHEIVKYDGKEGEEIVKQRYERFRSFGPFLRGEKGIIEKLKEEGFGGEEKKGGGGGRSRGISGDKVPRFVHLIGDIILNGAHAQLKTGEKVRFQKPIKLPLERSKEAIEEFKKGLSSEEKEMLSVNAKMILDKEGPVAVKEWLLKNSKKRVFVTDTTLRDAHQSLHATRMRTIDMIGAAKEMSVALDQAFSLEMWGGATFDVSLRFLHEDPWERVRRLRKLIPNICFQCLVRGSNVVGYTNYPENCVIEFCRKAAEVGIDVFRIFDCFNNTEKMRAATEAVIKANKIAEVCICYTSDFMDPNEKIYTLDYYCSIAKEIEKMGAHILGIKDMAGLMKPQNAEPFIKALKSVVNLPIHFHTHNTSGNALATCLNMADAGCEIIDLAISSMADLTAQPSLNGFLAARERTSRPAYIPFKAVEGLASYFSVNRSYYKHMESGQLASTARVYEHEIPGGQYSNLLVQSKALGIWDKWDQALDMYRDCNKLLGNLIKVTPSSKVVGDLALFLLGKGLSISDVKEGKIDITYPTSVVNLFKGGLGYPHHWKAPFKLSDEFIGLRERVLKGEKVRDENVKLEDVNFDNVIEEVKKEVKDHKVNEDDVMSYLMYPDVYKKYLSFCEKFGKMCTYIPTSVFMYGMDVGDSFIMRVPFKRIDKELIEILGLKNPLEGKGKIEEGESELEKEAHIRAGKSAFGEELRESIVWSSEFAEESEVELNVKVIRLSGADYYGKRKLSISINGILFIIEVEGMKEGGSALAQIDVNDKSQYGSPLTGVIGNINVKVGDEVKKGDCMGKVVAMKMEIKLEAPFDGVIIEVNGKEGDKVVQNSLILKIKAK